MLLLSTYLEFSLDIQTHILMFGIILYEEVLPVITQKAGCKGINKLKHFTLLNE